MGPDSNTLHLDARKIVFLAALSCYSAMTSALGPLFSPCQPPGGSIPSTVPPPPPGTPTGNSSKTLAFKTPRRPARAALQVPVSRLPTSNPSTNAADLKNLGSPIAIPADSGTPPDSPRRANKRTKSSSAPRRSNDGSRSPVDPLNTSPTLGFPYGTPSYAFPGQFVYPPELEVSTGFFCNVYKMRKIPTCDAHRAVQYAAMGTMLWGVVAMGGGNSNSNLLRVCSPPG